MAGGGGSGIRDTCVPHRYALNISTANTHLSHSTLILPCIIKFSYSAFYSFPLLHVTAKDECIAVARERHMNDKFKFPEGTPTAL